MESANTEDAGFYTRSLSATPKPSDSSTMLSQVKDNASAAYNWFGEMYLTIIWRTLVANLILLAISLLAVFLYGSLYYTYIPQSVQRRQLYFQRTQIIKERVDTDGSLMKTSVHALRVEVPILSGDASSGLTAGQAYNIHLEIDMPESEVNHNAGTFMITALYYDRVEKLLTSSSRLVMLRYRSWLLKIMDTLVYSPLYLIGLSEQSQTRNIELFKNYKENAYRPTTLITIDIDNPNLQIYEASIIFYAQFSGLRYFMYYWPITTAAFGVLSIWFLLGIMFSSSWFALSGTSKTTSHSSQTSPSIARNDKSLQSGVKSSSQLTGTIDMPDDQGLFEREPTPQSREKPVGRTDKESGDNPSENVSNLGVTAQDSSDTTCTSKHNSSIRRRNPTAEEAST